jgi:hypothetical protein
METGIGVAPVSHLNLHFWLKTVFWYAMKITVLSAVGFPGPLTEF